MTDQNEKTEQPSARKLQKAREQGDFPVSKELVAAVQFLTFVFALQRWGGQWFADSQVWFPVTLQQAFRSELSLHTLFMMTAYLLRTAFVPLGMAGGILVVVSLASHLGMTGMGFSLKKFSAGLGAMNPIARLKQIRENAFASTLQAAIMLAGSGAAVYWVASKSLLSFPLLPLASLRQGSGVVFDFVLSLLWKGAAVFVFFGVIDMLRQRNKFSQRLRMTKQEAREEYKESEGNPEIKMRLRRIRRDLLRRRMMQDVPTATAVLVNPTHYAVALRYDHEAMRCPVVVAKGKNFLALRIRTCAQQNQVPIIENPPLAQALYKSVDVGQEIPPHLYRAIAEVLAYVYRLANLTAKGGPGQR